MTPRSEQQTSLPDQLREFAAGATPIEAFHTWIGSALIEEVPLITKVQSGKRSADLSFESECVMYLDMVTDPDDPNYDEAEARRLAGSLCALLIQVEDEQIRSAFAHLARWAPRTTCMIRKYEAESLSRAAFERFISRRPWPADLRSTVKRLGAEQLKLLADGLEGNDFRAVRTAFGD